MKSSALLINQDVALEAILSQRITDYQEEIIAKTNEITENKKQSKAEIPLKYSVDELKKVHQKLVTVISNGNKMAVKEMYLALINKIHFKKTKPRIIDSFEVHLQPGVATELLESLNNIDDPKGSSFSLLNGIGIVLHSKEI